METASFDDRLTRRGKRGFCRFLANQPTGKEFTCLERSNTHLSFYQSWKNALFMVGFLTLLVILPSGKAKSALQEIATDQSTLPSTETASETESETASDADVTADLLIDRFTPWLPQDDELADGIERAWEYRPYRVAVWICSDGSPLIASNLKNLIEDLGRRAELIDCSGWNLHIGEAPSQFRVRFLRQIETIESIHSQDSLTDLPLLGSYDKLMVVNLRSQYGAIEIKVREFDLATQQWGPLQFRTAAEVGQLAAEVMDSIRMAFMPLTKIDRVDIKGADTVIYLQVRARDASLRLERVDDGTMRVKPIETSPVLIQPQEKFLPVVRRSDRDGNLLKIEPMEFTFLTKTGVSDTGEVKCSFVSSQRAPLAGRKSRLADRYALVIRPPRGSSTLSLSSMKEPYASVEGIKVYSMKPESRASSLDEGKREFEYLGKTDFEGKIEIPPTEDGIRVLTVGRGARGGLMRLPVVPGLFPDLSARIPDDETSLYAEGMIRGFEQEILNQVIQREVFESEIISLLDEGDLDKAKSKFREFQTLESLRSIRNRMANEQTRLESMDLDSRQKKFIVENFQQLSGILTNQAGRSRETLIQARIQTMSDLPGAINPQDVAPREAQEDSQ